MRIYENPQKTSENRLPARSYYIPSGVSEYTLLNGSWDFSYFKRDINVPNVIENWDKISVPSCWQILGYEEPNYTNTNYPFPYDPPYVPNENPCGVYKRDFEVLKKWGKVYFVLEGVSSCAFVYINDKYVGFTQGSHNQAEFDVTDLVNEGKNTVLVKVLKWCVGSYLEDQDMFRHNGIFRDCYLLQRPEGHIVDVEVIPNEKNFNINIDGDANLKIYDKDEVLLDTTINSNYTFAPENPILWNAEKPYLYKIELERNGEIITISSGLRNIEISSKYELLINGTSVKLKGVNHHDTSKIGGWYQTNEEIIKDLELMKQLNINCIRTSHYPPPPFLTKLCDEMGFYVIMEADIECHGTLRRLPNAEHVYDVQSNDWTSTKPEWANEYLNRMYRMVELYKNNPSVIMWSTGNESGHGANHVKMIRWTKKRDNTRLIHCEDASRKGEFHNPDLFSCMYAPPAALEELALRNDMDMPVFLCEYAHAMGNGPGDIYEYNEMFYKYPKLIGGCIWEWADHVFVDNGVQKYGGDFESELTYDANFCCDGVVFADRSLKAGSLEAKAAYQPMATSFNDDVLTITNRYDFTNFDELKFVYTIEVDGVKTKEKEVAITLLPHEKFDLKINYDKISCKYGAYLNCYLYNGDYIVAQTQHELNYSLFKVEDETQYATLTQNDAEIIASGENFKYTFSKVYGNFTSIIIDSQEQLSAKTEISTFRAPIDNDRNVKQFWIFENIWQGENVDRAFTNVRSCEIVDGKIVVNAAYAGVSRLPLFNFVLEVTILKSGKINFNVVGDIRKDAYWLQRLGFDFHLNQDFNSFSYFGKGPYENYCDLSHASYNGMYESTVDAEYVPYVYPQEYGNHANTKILKIGKMVFASENGFEFSTSRFSNNNILKAKHTDELVDSGKIYLHINYKSSGVGSNSCGPFLNEKYRLSEKHIEFNFSLQPNK